MRTAVFLALLLAAPLMAEIPGAWPEVNLANANVVVDRTEIRLHWAGPVMEVRRIYNARSHKDGPLGFGWRLSYTRQVAHKPGDRDLTITEDDGAVSRFQRVTGARFEPAGCCSGQAVELLSSGQFKRTREGQTELFDGRGRLIEIRDANELSIAFTYGPFGLAEVKDSVKRSFKLAYSPEGHVESITEAFEGYAGAAARAPRSVSFRHDDKGDLVGVTDAARAETKYAYDKDHRMIKVVQPTLERATLTYDVKTDWVTGIVLPGGRKLTYAFSADKTGHGVKATDDAGRVTTHRYEGDTLKIVDPEGLITLQKMCTVCGGYFDRLDAAGGTLGHEHAGPTFTSKDAAGGVATLERDPATGQVVRRVDRAGGVTSFGYDTRGNLVSVTDPDKNVTKAERDDRGFVSAVVRADQARVELAAGPLGLPEKIKEPAGGTTTIEYDAAGLPRRVADERGRAVTITYNAADQPTSIADAGGMQRDLRYDDLGRVIGEVAGADHHRTTFVYGAPDSGPGEGRLTRVQFGTSGETRFGYDTKGNVTQVARDGKTYALRYDRSDRPVAITDPVSATVRLDYDQLGHVTRVTDPLGNRTDSKYDAGGRLASRTDAVGRTFSFAYDGEGRVRQLKLAGGREVTAVYDASGRLISVKPSTGAAEIYSYSPLGRVASVTDTEGRKTSLTSDAGRVTVAEDPVLGRVRYGYTADGRLSEVLAANGRKITITYDDQTRTRKIVTSTDQAIETRLDWEDRRLEETGPGYHLRWSYYEDGLLKDVTDLATQRTHRYRYDGLGHRTVWSDPDGRDTTYTYDAGGRLVKVDDRLGATVALTYDAAGRRTKRELAGALTTTYAYDAAGRLTDLAHTAKDQPVARTQLAYGPAGLVRELTQDAKKIAVEVDAAGRLKAAPAATPTYDGPAVQSEAPATGKPIKYQYDALTRLVGAVLAGGGDVKLGYGPDLRWTAYAGPLGRRELVYETDNLIAEKESGGAVEAEYVMGPGLDEPLAMKRDGRLFALVTDHLGSVVKVLDPNGTPVREVTYTLAGEMTATGTVPCAFGFTGRPYEPHTGLVNLRLRWLNPRLSSFQTMDPLIPASRFDYAHGNPVTYVDPLGAAVDAFLTGDAYAGSSSLASTGAGPVLMGSAGAAALGLFSAQPAAAAPDLARLLVRTAAGRAIGRSLADASPLAAGPRPPSQTSGAIAEVLERAAPLPDRNAVQRGLVTASARTLSRGPFPTAARHVAHRLLDAVWATGPLDAPPLSAAELVQQALAEALTLRVTPVSPPRSPCERIH